MVYQTKNMQLQKRKDLLVQLGAYMLSKNEDWQAAKQKASRENSWFIPEFIDLSVKSIAQNYLQPEQLDQLIERYSLPQENKDPKKVGIVMAGNIPLVGFHDFLCVFLTGNVSVIKLSSKDETLLKHLIQTMSSWDTSVERLVQVSELLKGCDAYIATGSNNSSRYFDYYFQKYPHIIRRNRTSVAVLDGNESAAELDQLADDVYQYFGLGCRNVTKLFVPRNYDFVPLLTGFKKYDYLANHNKYKNNYDYQLSILLLNNKYYMSNESILLVENESPFSPISELHYEYYDQKEAVRKKLHDNEAIQCVVGDESTGFGKAQKPGICDYADGVDTIEFLVGLSSEASYRTEEVRRP
jgi:hypothetical protein